ncbi:MAG: cell division protein SepF [Oscillospiraceae bacterium]|nr:cell division protein SepF [Oscillospiraceae bacterium]
MSLVDKIKNIMGLPEDDSDEEMDLITNENVTNYRSISSNKTDKVLNINTTTQLQVILVKPERYEDAGSIADNLNSKHTVVLNLEDTSRDISRRLLDFLSGVAYANGGQIKRVANGTYIITPYNVDIMGNLLDEIGGNDVFFN